MNSRLLLIIFVSLGILISSDGFAKKIENVIVSGNSFSILAEQQIHFVPLTVIPKVAFNKFPQNVDLRPVQSPIKSQGQRGACTYFVVSSLVESVFKQKLNIDLDISEEYLAWASKVKMKLRPFEEDSSVVVGVKTIQNMGFMLEPDLPYQTSWFNTGMPCDGIKKSEESALRCFAHAGPQSSKKSKIYEGSELVFEEVSSSSLDLVKALSSNLAPVTFSILAHSETWKLSEKDGKLILTDQFKKDCIEKIKSCSGHAVLLVGYDLNKREFIFKNSWGTDWGNQGYGSIPFDYVDQMSDRKLITGHFDGFGINLQKR